MRGFPGTEAGMGEIIMYDKKLERIQGAGFETISSVILYLILVNYLRIIRYIF